MKIRAFLRDVQELFRLHRWRPKDFFEAYHGPGAPEDGGQSSWDRMVASVCKEHGLHNCVTCGHYYDPPVGPKPTRKLTTGEALLALVNEQGQELRRLREENRRLDQANRNNVGDIRDLVMRYDGSRKWLVALGRMGGIPSTGLDEVLGTGVDPRRGIRAQETAK